MLIVSYVQLMSYIQKTKPDPDNPVKFGPDHKLMIIEPFFYFQGGSKILGSHEFNGKHIRYELTLSIK